MKVHSVLHPIDVVYYCYQNPILEELVTCLCRFIFNQFPKSRAFTDPFKIKHQKFFIGALNLPRSKKIRRSLELCFVRIKISILQDASKSNALAIYGKKQLLFQLCYLSFIMGSLTLLSI